MTKTLLLDVVHTAGGMVSRAGSHGSIRRAEAMRTRRERRDLVNLLR
jgi:hypothetical protein